MSRLRATALKSSTGLAVHRDRGSGRQWLTESSGLEQRAVEEVDDAALVLRRLVADAADVLGGRHRPDLLRTAARELVVLLAHVLDVAAVRRPDDEERLLDLRGEVGQVRRRGRAGE